jgi:hypothetical protein
VAHGVPGLRPLLPGIRLIDEASNERSRSPWRLVALVAGAVVLIGGGIGIGLALAGSGGTGSGSSGPRTIDMTGSTALSCLPPSSGLTGHQVRSQLFQVQDNVGDGYILGWTLSPYRPHQRTYHFTGSGSLLALEPVTGGKPLGYGTGKLTVHGSGDAGSINATVALKRGGTIPVTGDWTCPSRTP